MGGGTLLNNEHAAEIPSHVPGKEALIQGYVVRQADLDERRSMGLPGRKLIRGRQIFR